jgi:hypothetical protein
MQIVVPILLSCFFIVFPTLKENDPSDVMLIEEITTSFKTGSSKDLAKFFDNGIELNINGTQGEYSKIQAELVMRDFFKKFPPVDFRIIHQGSTLEQILFLIGDFQTENLGFRILLKGKSSKENVKIYSLDIVRE